MHTFSEIPSYRLKYDNEKEEIEKNLLLLSKQVSNLEKVTNIALKFCIELPKKWFFADYHTKQQLQQLLFPSGIFYDKKSDKCRTSKINSVFFVRGLYSASYHKKEKRNTRIMSRIFRFFCFGSGEQDRTADLRVMNPAL